MFDASTQCVVIALVVACFVINVSSSGEFPEYPKYLPSPLVCIADGCIIGTERDGLDGSQYEAFFGIPYARPPVEKLRFRDPVPVEPWKGYYDATYERSKCVQKNDARPYSMVEGSEDCLYLNLYRPKDSIHLLPVMFYIHGGRYASGSASNRELGPERLMDTRMIIVIVIQYRVGVFGFLSTDDGASPGNYGLKDQSMALRWAQKNVEKFGGDPKRVTLVGHEAGAASVQMHMMSQLSRGAFSRAICMSGSALAFWNYNIDQAKVARRQAAIIGIPGAYKISTDKLVEALRWVDAYTLGKSIDLLKYFYVHPTGLYQPGAERYVTNGTFLSDEPRALWAAGKYERIPWIAGILPNDGAADSLGIITNTTLLNHLNKRSRKFIPRLAGGDTNLKSVQMLKDRFFPNGTQDQWLNGENFLRLQQLTTESSTVYPLALSVKQHLAQKTSKRAPISIYYFNFKGNYSQSFVYSYTLQDFGVCHADELLYLFRNSAAVPDYPISSPEWIMAKGLVDYFVKFVYDGITGPQCKRMDCQLLEFTNSENPKTPVELNLVNGFHEGMFQFWKEFYQLQGI